MTDIKTWVLTDTAQGIWMEELELTSPELGVEGASVRKRVLRGGLCDGVDVIEVDNGAFQYTILPTRGMGIWRGSYKGLDVGWQSPVAGPVHPGFVDLQDRGKLGWLTGFDEAIVRCGLDNNGGPAVDIVPNNMGVPSEVELTLHGRIANLPAHRVEIRVEPGVERHLVFPVFHAEPAIDGEPAGFHFLTPDRFDGVIGQRDRDVRVIDFPEGLIVIMQRP